MTVERISDWAMTQFVKVKTTENADAKLKDYDRELASLQGETDVESEMRDIEDLKGYLTAYRDLLEEQENADPELRRRQELREAIRSPNQNKFPCAS